MAQSPPVLTCGFPGFRRPKSTEADALAREARGFIRWGEMTWEYWVLNVTVVERWSEKRQVEEMAAFQAKLNEAGRIGWEMIGFETVPLTGRFSEKIKGYIYLCFFKRPIA